MAILELAQSVGLSPKKTSSTQGGEYKSACPRCGGKDRFFIQPNRIMKNCTGYYRCRQCDCSGDAIQFAVDFTGLDFKQAIEQIATTIPTKKIFFTLPKKQFTPTKLEHTPCAWMSKASSFIEWAHQQTFSQQTILAVLHKRGLPIDAVRKYKIGWNPLDIWRGRDTWGLEHNTSESKLWLPKGIVIPSIELNGCVNRIKIRRTDWKDGDKWGKYIAIPGSMNGLNVIGDRNSTIMLVVESELDAYAIHYAVGDLALVVSVGSNSKNPDNICDYIARRISSVLICHDNDDAGNVMLKKWTQLYPHAKSYPAPIGKDIGEAIEQGFQIRPWILQHGWANSPDRDLVNWALQHMNEDRVTKSTYFIFEKEIALGASSSRAKTGELQKGLALMRRLVTGQS